MRASFSRARLSTSFLQTPNNKSPTGCTLYNTKSEFQMQRNPPQYFSIGSIIVHCIRVHHCGLESSAVPSQSEYLSSVHTRPGMLAPVKHRQHHPSPPHRQHHALPHNHHRQHHQPVHYHHHTLQSGRYSIQYSVCGRRSVDNAVSKNWHQ